MLFNSFVLFHPILLESVPPGALNLALTVLGIIKKLSFVSCL
nr:MAG TPA: hypothetical protein [Caudoviricetes sp.]